MGVLPSVRIEMIKVGGYALIPVCLSQAVCMAGA